MTVQNIVFDCPNITKAFSEMTVEERDEDCKYVADKICEVLELEIKKTPTDVNGLKQYLLGNEGEDEEAQLAIYWSQYSSYNYQICIGLSRDDGPCEVNVSGEGTSAMFLCTRGNKDYYTGFKVIKNTKGSFFGLYVNNGTSNTQLAMQSSLAAMAPASYTFFKIDNIIYRRHSNYLYRRYPSAAILQLNWGGALPVTIINTYKYNYIFPLQNSLTHEEITDCFNLVTAQSYSTSEKILIDGKKYFIVEIISNGSYYIVLDEA